MAGSNAYLEHSVRVGHREMAPGSGRLLEAKETGFEIFERITAVKNATTTVTLANIFKTSPGRGPIFIKSETKPDGDGNVTMKINNADANNYPIKIKPIIMLCEVPTDFRFINASTTTDEDMIIYGYTDSSLT